jgi:hypothetical protein
MRALVLILLCITTPVIASPGAVTFDAAAFTRFLHAPIGGKIDVAAFPAGPGMLSEMSFERIDVYAPGARIVVVDASGEHELPRSQRIHLIGYSKDGTTRVGLSFDPDVAATPYGAGSGPSGSFVVRSERVGGEWQFSAIRAESALPPGVTPEFPANEDSLPNPYAPPAVLSHLVAEEVLASTPARIAVVAIDTDTTFMNLRFSGNTTQATAWIADLFTQMNVMYRRDLDVILQQGTTFLRTASDPYANADTSATSAQLNEFGTYWQNNYSSGTGAVSRSFAALLSGNSSSGNSASGIAWVNSYCRTANNGGSYSVNQIFTNSVVGVSLSAFIVGHELGHNFGAAHTHCSNASTGSYPTATGTIDQCYKAESGCYAGTTSCPTSGPGAPQGTVMSYCHVGGTNGAAGCGQNVQQFHPTHITQLRNLIATNTPSCLRSEAIFGNGFE